MMGYRLCAAFILEIIDFDSKKSSDLFRELMELKDDRVLAGTGIVKSPDKFGFSLALHYFG